MEHRAGTFIEELDLATCFRHLAFRALKAALEVGGIVSGDGLLARLYCASNKGDRKNDRLLRLFEDGQAGE